ncbi:hypothetical protein DSECCO2_362610 [anaerobic digester metagenome]
MMRGVGGAGAVVHEEGLCRVDLPRVPDERDRRIGQVFGEVVAIFGHRRLSDRVVVVDQGGVILVRLAAQESVIPFESPADGPVSPGRGQVHLVLRAEVPFAEHIGVVAPLDQHLCEGGALERDVAV